MRLVRGAGPARVGAALAGSVLAAALLAACGTQSTGGPGGSSSPSTSAAPTQSNHPVGQGGLRGVAVRGVDCREQASQPKPGPMQPIRQTPVRLVVCPLKMVEASGPPADLRPPPKDLLAALALPDLPRKPGEFACAAYADVPQTVYAQLPDGRYMWVWIPSDLSCGHYLPQALTLLMRYAHQGQLVG